MKPTTSSPIDRAAVASTIADVDADRRALEVQIRDLRIAAAHDRIRGKSDIRPLLTARSELAALDDVRAGLIELEAAAEVRELQAEIAAQSAIEDDVHAKLLVLQQKEREAWATGGADFSAEAKDQPRFQERAHLHAAIMEQNQRREAARGRMAAAEKRLAELAQPTMLAASDNTLSRAW